MLVDVFVTQIIIPSGRYEDADKFVRTSRLEESTHDHVICQYTKLIEQSKTQRNSAENTSSHQSNVTPSHDHQLPFHPLGKYMCLRVLCYIDDKLITNRLFGAINNLEQYVGNSYSPGSICRST